MTTYFTNGTYKTIEELTNEELANWIANREEQSKKELEANDYYTRKVEHKTTLRTLRTLRAEAERRGLN